MLTRTLRQAKRTVIAVGGFTIILIGVVMLVTPGPGWLVIVLGLSVLAIEFVWARKLLNRLKRTGVELGATIRETWRARRRKSKNGLADTEASADRDRSRPKRAAGS
ncbi:MAG: PGPGW domain-containing protein [Candidatus Binataceae bacterium]